MAVFRQRLAILILLILGLLALRTFLGPEFYDGHDSQAHLVRLWQFDKAIKTGQIPPQWAPDLYAGRGYPLFIFAYPLPYFIAETWHLLSFGLGVAIKLTLVTVYLVSLVGMYYLAGFLGAILWGIAPYMFVKIFITGSLGVVTAFAFIPWFFWAVKQKRWLTAAIFLALWILSHPGKVVIFAPLLIIFFLQDLKHWRQWLATGLLALGLSAWYFLPANLEIPYTHFKEFVSRQYANDFVPLSRLLYSPWGTGAPGWSDTPLSQQVGIAQWLAVLLAVLFIKTTWPYLLVFGLSIFLMLAQSKFIWDLPTPLQSVSTPWRFLALAVFSSALAGAAAVKQIKVKFWRNLAAAILILLALYGNRNHMRINDKRVYDQSFFENYTGVATGWNEHLPLWVKTVDFNRALPMPGQLNTLYYPGWQVKVDSQPVEIWPSVNGLIEFATPSAGVKIEAEFTPTPLRRAARIISLISLAAVLFYCLRHRFNHVKQVFLAHVRVKR